MKKWINLRIFLYRPSSLASFGDFHKIFYAFYDVLIIQTIYNYTGIMRCTYSVI